MNFFSECFQRFLNFLSFKTNPRSVTQTFKKLELVKVNYFFSKPFETQIELAVVAFLVSVIDLEKSIFEKQGQVKVNKCASLE